MLTSNNVKRTEDELAKITRQLKQLEEGYGHNDPYGNTAGKNRGKMSQTLKVADGYTGLHVQHQREDVASRRDAFARGVHGVVHE